jgi:hypothetical protein
MAPRALNNGAPCTMSVAVRQEHLHLFDAGVSFSSFWALLDGSFSPKSPKLYNLRAFLE